MEYPVISAVDDTRSGSHMESYITLALFKL
uniref:Uncharacterized protein n=1 Tax=Arundo donax TaxID=35708 RepID=A0A0A8ZC26_ARUDO